MSRRVFVNVRRGPMDNTAVCVYPWEMPILQLVHMQEVKEVSIDDMANQKDGVVKVEQQKLKKLKNLNARYAPDLRGQLELMAYVDPEADPANDPAAEYGRLVDKYGMDKDLPIPCVARIYGEYQGGGAFDAKLKEFVGDNAPMPQVLKQMLDDEADEIEEQVAEQPRKRKKAA